MEKDGKRQYDSTSIFTIDGSEIELYFYAQVAAWFGEEYMIINNITIQYEESYLHFDYNSYKSIILKEIDFILISSEKLQKCHFYMDYSISF